jgi:hypothetical protein
MLFGNPTDFAIEAMTEPHLSAPSAVWGRMRVICDKQIYGDYENPHCALYPAYCQFRWFRENVIDLWDSSFNGLSNSELHDLLDHAIYGDDNRNTQEIESDSMRYGRFNFLTNWGEQFDGYKSFIVSPMAGTLIILRRDEGGLLIVASCSTQGFVKAADEYLDWFHAETERLT